MTIMNNKSNPWLDMDILSRRRVDAHDSHDLFWIIDPEGNYGLRIQTDGLIDNEVHTIKLKGVRLIKDNKRSDQTALFFILQNKEDWEIFHALCEDLIKVILEHPEGAKMIMAVEHRLKRWQQLLQQDTRTPFSIEKQMGLFSELYCLERVLAQKYGIRQSITFWNGPEADKQDFLLDDAVLEVKSYRTSKGDAVSISSLKQLHSEKNKIYLTTYALTVSRNGKSIEELANVIRTLLKVQGSASDLEGFESKLISYGYVPELIKEELNSFIVDKQRIFHVTEEFPKITPENTADAIVSVTYSIDLAKCEKFEINLETFLK